MYDMHVGSCERKSKKFKIDNVGGSDSNSDDDTSHVTSSSVSANTNKKSTPSPMWLSARTKLQKFAFHRASKSEISSHDDSHNNIKSRSLSPAGGVSVASPSFPLTQSFPLVTSSMITESLQSVDDTLTDNEDECFTESDDEYSDEQKRTILDFINNGSKEELCGVPGCSLTKAKLLVDHIPIDGWDDLVSEL